MGVKGEHSRARIIECAQALFGQKGYCAVTMQEISEAAGFSRGGLYRHFSSTEEIFLEIIRLEQERAAAQLERALSNHLSADRILRAFLRARMALLIHPVHSFDIAISEFAANSKKGRAALAKRAEDSILILTRLIESGNETGVFACSDPRLTATHILWSLEGMARHAGLIPISEPQLEAQLALLNRLLQK